MNQQCPSKGQRNGLRLSSRTASLDSSPHVILVQSLGNAQWPHHTFPVMFARECLGQSPPVHKHLTLTFDQVDDGGRSLSLPTTTGPTHLIQCWGCRLDCVRVSRTDVFIDDGVHVVGDDWLSDPVDSLEDLDQALVFLRWHRLADEFAELGQFEPGLSLGMGRGVYRQMCVLGQQVLQSQQVIDEFRAPREVGRRRGNNPGRSVRESVEVNRWCRWYGRWWCSRRRSLYRGIGGCLCCIAASIALLGPQEEGCGSRR